MKNFMSRIECVVEPTLFCDRRGETIEITMRCRTNNEEVCTRKIEDVNFLRSYFDVIFDHMREEIREKILVAIKEN